MKKEDFEIRELAKKYLVMDRNSQIVNLLASIMFILLFIFCIALVINYNFEEIFILVFIIMIPFPTTFMFLSIRKIKLINKKIKRLRLKDD